MRPILNLITNLEPDGAQTALLDTVSRLDSGGYRMFVAFLAGRPRALEGLAPPPSGGVSPDGKRLGGVRVIDLSRNGRFDPASLPRLVGVLRRERIGLVHTHLAHAGVIGKYAARLARIDSVTTRHYAWDQGERRIAYRLENRLTGGSAAVIAVSHAVERYLVANRIAPRERITVIENGVDEGWFDPACVGEGRADGRANEGDRPFTIGTAGRCHPQKGHAVLLRAFERILATGARAILEIAGDGELRGQLEGEARRRGLGDRIRFLGAIPHREMRGRLARWDLFVMPSLWEGFGIAAAEAMAMELPVVASRIEGLSELVADGETGILVPVNAPDVLAEAVLSLIADPGRRVRMGRAGRQRIIARFTADRAAARVGEIYDRLLG